ncbi:MAG: hypothetical protein ACHQ5A_14265 [Opitutales bacterium]
MWRRLPLTALPLVLASPCAAVDGVRAAEEMSLEAGRGTIVDCPHGLIRVAPTSPETVDVSAPSPVLFHAKALGRATPVVWPKGGERRVCGVTVEPNREPLPEMTTALDHPPDLPPMPVPWMGPAARKGKSP